MRWKIEQRHIDMAVASDGQFLTECCPIAQSLRELVHPELCAGSEDIFIDNIGESVVVGRLSNDADYFTTTNRKLWHTLKPRAITIKEVSQWLKR